jgi:hypothetical protein
MVPDYPSTAAVALLIDCLLRLHDRLDTRGPSQITMAAVTAAHRQFRLEGGPDLGESSLIHGSSGAWTMMCALNDYLHEQLTRDTTTIG